MTGLAASAVWLAARAVQKAVRLTPLSLSRPSPMFAVVSVATHMQVHNALGFCYFSMEKTDLAIAEYRKAVDLQQGYVTAWNNLGDAYERSKQWRCGCGCGCGWARSKRASVAQVSHPAPCVCANLPAARPRATTTPPVCPAGTRWPPTRRHWRTRQTTRLRCRELTSAGAAWRGWGCRVVMVLCLLFVCGG